MAIQFSARNSWQAVLNESRRRKEKRGKLKNIQCQKPLPGKVGYDTAGWNRLSGGAVLLVVKGGVNESN
jgi:hypothetical protein